ncbi:Lipase EstA/Esterase EstB family-containing protein [Aphelenchoides bicaudatus]|nr:Lipase EstA/Esterase EstB family-containing protein [Aphelenchoides bicaudatus]
MRYILILTILLFYCRFGASTISDDFYNFIVSNYGKATAQLIARKDFGSSGSYGGGQHQPGRKTPRRPVIFVHGMMTKASTTFQWDIQMKNYMPRRTEPAGPNGFPIQAAMRCQHVKGVRALIEVVSNYTNSDVDVVTYSLGGPIARKAILGGKCVDTGENLGGSLTSIVQTYLGVAGPQHGAVTCGGFGVGVCNRINGIGCNSRFLNDINSRTRYEGSKIYVLQSTSDEIVGLNSCGTRSSEIRGQDRAVTVNGLGHVQTCATTSRIQYNLLNKGTQ